MPSPSPLNSHTQILLVICASSIVVLSLWAYRREVNDGKFHKGKGTISSTGGKAKQQDTSANGGPMFEYTNPILSERVLSIAKQRAKRWMSYQVEGANKMVGQVGGLSVHKRPMLTCEPDLILKPLSLDHRGIREIAFYEAIQASTKRSGFETYADLFGPREEKPRTFAKRSAMALFTGRSATNSGGPTETQPCNDKEAVKLEIKLLHRVELFIPEYLGIVEYPDGPPLTGTTEGLYGLNANCYIALRNLTTHFSKPCVLDLKMGTVTYEPDAPEDKKLRERSKYPSQEEFGFRIIGMRVYSPGNIEAGEDGYIYFPKQFGRSLESRDQVKLALRIFFGGKDLLKEVRANRSTAIQRILTKLKLIRGWFRDNSVFVFCASSLLVVYEGSTESNELGGIDPDSGSVSMIDFGRIRRNGTGADIGYLKGLQTLIQILEEILRESFWSQEYDYVQ